MNFLFIWYAARKNYVENNKNIFNVAAILHKYKRLLEGAC